MLPKNFPDFMYTADGKRAKTLKMFDVKPKLDDMLSEEIGTQMIKILRKGIITTSLETQHYIDVVTQMWTLFTDNYY